MRFGLRARFIIVISLILLVVFAAIAYFLIRNERITLQRDLNSSSKAFADLATRPIGDAYSAYQAAGGLRVQQETQKFTGLDDNVTRISVVDLAGQTLLAVRGPAIKVSDSAAMSFDAVYSQNPKGVTTRIVEPYVNAVGQHSFAITYDFSDQALNDSSNRQALTIVIFALLGLLISAYVTYELINTLFLRPIEHVSQLAGLIGRGDYTRQIDSGRNDEIGDLAMSVNQMANTLKANIQKLQEVDQLKNEFIMITSHNLRTPLTVINGYIDILKNAKIADDTREMINMIERSTTSLATFSEDMLTISSIEAGNTQPMTIVNTTVAELLEPLQNNYNALANQKKIKLGWHLPAESTPLRLSVWYTRSALSNLLANAVKFTPEGGNIKFDLTVTGSEYRFAINDTGIGIPANEMNQLFTKFHRGTSTLQYDYEGTGIGLYASKLLVEAQRGHIAVQSEPGQGSTFTVSMPPAAA
jgi:signal transduction histidine kinase